MEPFSYELQEVRIAQRPVDPPDAAKLLVYDRKTNTCMDSIFSETAEFLCKGDLLIFNNSKVIPSRLFGVLPGGGEAEILLLSRIASGQWRAMGRPLKKFRPGTRIEISSDLVVEILERTGTQEVTVELRASTGDADTVALQKGFMPIPPYIRGGRSDERDTFDYQSIFASIEGSVAAPTASLHFTKETMDSLQAKGVQIQEVTLHVGAASFLALWELDETAPSKRPGFERYQYDSGVVESIRETRKAGGRVIAVGTTVVRALESMFLVDDTVRNGELLDTNLFISPGFHFRGIDGMVTNFHQPRTTHLLLVEAFAGRGGIQEIYSHALSHPYRFLSYGDGTLIL